MRVAILGTGNISKEFMNASRIAEVEACAVYHREMAKAAAFAETHANFKVMEVDEAAKAGDIIMMLAPDELQGEIYAEHIAPYMTEGKTLAFAHGFNIHYKVIQPPANCDVIMIAPKGPGHVVRRTYTEGQGVPDLHRAGLHGQGQGDRACLCFRDRCRTRRYSGEHLQRGDRD